MIKIIISNKEHRNLGEYIYIGERLINPYTDTWEERTTEGCSGAWSQAIRPP